MFTMTGVSVRHRRVDVHSESECVFTIDRNTNPVRFIGGLEDFVVVALKPAAQEPEDLGIVHPCLRKVILARGCAC